MANSTACGRMRLLELAVQSGAALLEAVLVAKQFENYILGHPIDYGVLPEVSFDEGDFRDTKKSH